MESAAYFVVSEGLANVAKYAHATQASVAVRCESDRVTVEVADDGVGGADTANGSGLRGLADRVAALDGTLTLESPAGRGTQLRAEIPVALRPGEEVSVAVAPIPGAVDVRFMPPMTRGPPENSSRAARNFYAGVLRGAGAPGARVALDLVDRDPWPSSHIELRRAPARRSPCA